MSLPVILFLSVLGTAVGYGLARLPGPWRYLSAVVPAALFAAFIGHLGTIVAGETIVQAVSWAPSLGVDLRLVLDGFSLLFVLLITGIGTLVTIYATAYFADAPPGQRARFIALILVFMTAMLGTVLSDDLIAMFVFWEVTSVTSFLLIGFDMAKREARRAALQSLIVTAGGGLALFAAILLIGGRVGTFSLTEIAAQADVLVASPNLAAIIALILVGAFTKSAQFPFQFWLPEAMAAPTPASAYLHSATMVKLGVYLLARFDAIFATVPAFGFVLMVFGVATMALASLNALRANEYKAVLAHSTVASLGVLVMLIGLDAPLATVAVCAYIVAHALYKAALFFSAGTVIHATGVAKLDELGGLARHLPFTAAAAVLAGLSMAGLPPMVGFLAKEYMFDAQLGSAWRLVPLIAAVVVNAVMVAVAAAVAIRPFFGRRGKIARVHHGETLGLVAAPAALGVFGVLLGVAPGFMARPLVEPAAAALRTEPLTVSFSLWHGLTPALALSATVLLLGAVIAWRWAGLRAAAARLPVGRQADADRRYHAVVDAVLRVARASTAWLQNGDQRRYTLIVCVSLVLAAAFTVLRSVGPEIRSPAGPLLALPTALLVFGVIGGVVAARARSLVPGLLGVGVFGYVSALIYLLNGAPDLALTQFAVETLVLVVVIAVLVRLPSIGSRTRTKRERRVDVAVSGAFTVLMFIGLASMLDGPFDSRLSDFYAATSYLDAFGRNVVNVIIVDFRGLDTLGEISVVAFATMSVWALLRRRSRKKRS